jgi:hypothetical protein
MYWVIDPHRISIAALTTKGHFFLNLIFASSLLLHHFFPSIGIGTAPQPTRPLYSNLK